MKNIDPREADDPRERAARAAWESGLRGQEWRESREEEAAERPRIGSLDPIPFTRDAAAHWLR